MDSIQKAYYQGVESGVLDKNPHPQGTAEHFEWNVGRCDSPAFHPEPAGIGLIAFSFICMLVFMAAVGAVIDVL